jgi:hypothetical protein
MTSSGIQQTRASKALYLFDPALRVKETLENQAHTREKTCVSAGADWAHGRQAAWILRLRARAH